MTGTDGRSVGRGAVALRCPASWPRLWFAIAGPVGFVRHPVGRTHPRAMRLGRSRDGEQQRCEVAVACRWPGLFVVHGGACCTDEVRRVPNSRLEVVTTSSRLKVDKA